jgi:serine/threonine protein kinase
MHQNEYPIINTIKISLKEQFHWVKCPSPSDPNRACLLQSYATKSAATILEPWQWKIDKLLSIEHPQLQSIIDVFATDNSLHIVQELDQWDCAIDKIPYSPIQARLLLQEITPALIYLHDRGITHGNISPHTIVVNEQNKYILTNFLVITDLISEVGGDTYPRLRSQLEQIPILNLPIGQEWDLYSLGVTTIALLTNLDYQHLYDPISQKWQWQSYVDCSEELTRAIDRLLGQEQPQIAADLPVAKIDSAGASSHQNQPKDRQVANLAKIDRPQRYPHLYRLSIGLLILSGLGLLGYLIWGRSTAADPVSTQLQVFPQNKTLTVGFINRTPSRNRPQSQPRDYPKFKSYLETELRKKYGNDVNVELESALTTKEARTKIEQKKWDLAFASTATNALVAEDSKYEFLARMSATEDPYRDVCFFVMNDSKITSNKDFTPDRTIALPNEDSPIFIMPFYDLYGKKMRVNLGNPLGKIQEKVKSGEADVGVDFCKMVALRSEFRSLSPNRIIPVGGVFLSPKIEGSVDREYIKAAIAKAPDDVQVKANYTRSSGINYTQFRRINDRANQLLDCVDLTRNPVDFYCNKSTQTNKQN